MSDTPEIDALAYEERGLPGSMVVHVDVARKEARKVAELQATIESLNTAAIKLNAKLGDAANAAQAQAVSLAKSQACVIALQELIKAFVVGEELPPSVLAVDQRNLLNAYRDRVVATTQELRSALADEIDTAADQLRRAREAAERQELRISEAERNATFAQELTVLQEELSTIKDILCSNIAQTTTSDSTISEPPSLKPSSASPTVAPFSAPPAGKSGTGS